MLTPNPTLILKKDKERELKKSQTLIFHTAQWRIKEKVIFRWRKEKNSFVTRLRSKPTNIFLLSERLKRNSWIRDLGNI
jgi:hypothetical protein